MYSGHDTTVAPILHTLGIFNGIAPPYSSMIIFEMLEQDGLQVKAANMLSFVVVVVNVSLALPVGEDLLQEHHKQCLPSGNSWVYRALSS